MAVRLGKSLPEIESQENVEGVQRRADTSGTIFKEALRKLRPGSPESVHCSRLSKGTSLMIK